MGRHELSLTGADLAETRPPLPFRREFVNARIAVSVSDKDRVERHRGAGRVVERRFPSWTMRFADSEDRLAREIEDHNLMGVAIDDPDAIPTID